MLHKQLTLHSPAAEVINPKDVFRHDRPNTSDTKPENQVRVFTSLIYSKWSTTIWKKWWSWEVSRGVAQSAEMSQLGQLPWWRYSLWFNHRAEQDGELPPRLHFIIGTVATYCHLKIIAWGSHNVYMVNQAIFQLFAWRERMRGRGLISEQWSRDKVVTNVTIKCHRSPQNMTPISYCGH